MVKLAITGANGYIGSHLVKEMERRGIDFVAVDYSLSNISEKINTLKCDLFSEENIYTKMGKPETLLHLAWENGFIHNSKDHMLQLSKHYDFLTKMIDQGIKQICIMGSMHEVGYFEGPIDEGTPTNPLSQYAIAKNALRQSIELYCKNKGITFQWIRGFYIYGDDSYGNSIFAKIRAASLKGEKTFPFTKGLNKYDFISINELIQQICAVILQDEVVGIINCCTGKPNSLANQVEWYIKKYKLNIKLNYGAFPDRAYDSPAIWGDNKKIELIMEKRNEKD